jgi:hypothetical protein
MWRHERRWFKVFHVLQSLLPGWEIHLTRHYSLANAGTSENENERDGIPRILNRILYERNSQIGAMEAMSVLPKLASSLNIRSDVPNQVLAREIAECNDKKSVNELVENLSNKDKNIQSDCIKTLYELGELKPALIAVYDEVFIALLENKNNRMVWGAMSALDSIASINPKGIYINLTKILDAADKGSVITKDHGVNILIKLAADKAYTADALTILLEQLKSAATNQLPKYAEDAVPVITGEYKKDFIKVLNSRLGDMEKVTKQKRLEKAIHRLGK